MFKMLEGNQTSNARRGLYARGGCMPEGAAYYTTCRIKTMLTNGRCGGVIRRRACVRAIGTSASYCPIKIVLERLVLAIGLIGPRAKTKFECTTP